MTAVSGVVYDSGGSPLAGRTVRAYRRDTGVLLGSTVSSTGPVTAGDPYYPLTTLILRGNGTDGSTTITDESPTPKTVTVGGSAQLDTAVKQYGSASIMFDGTGDYLQVTGGAIGSGDFTIAGWVYVATPASAFIFLDTRTADLDAAGFVFYVRGTQKLAFGRGAAFTVAEGTTNVTANTWHHVELTRSSGTVRGFLDGVLEFTVTEAANFSNTVWKIGHQWNASGTISAGQIDDLCVTPGVARHTAAFSGSLPTEIIPAAPLLAAGAYSIDTAGYTGELNVICLDDTGGTTENDLIIRTTGV